MTIINDKIINFVISIDINNFSHLFFYLAVLYFKIQFISLQQHINIIILSLLNSLPCADSMKILHFVLLYAKDDSNVLIQQSYMRMNARV